VEENERRKQYQMGNRKSSAFQLNIVNTCTSFLIEDQHKQYYGKKSQNETHNANGYYAKKDVRRVQEQ
jgi:hypothetical protein